jgi:hypothetical protein
MLNLTIKACVGLNISDEEKCFLTLYLIVADAHPMKKVLFYREGRIEQNKTSLLP